MGGTSEIDKSKGIIILYKNFERIEKTLTILSSNRPLE